MRYAKIIPHDIANGEGVRVSLFVTGCDRCCPGCFNEELQNFDSGEYFSQGTINEIETLLKAPEVSGLSILGGEPLSQDVEGMMQLYGLCAIAHSLDKDVWLWTGWSLEEVFGGNDWWMPSCRDDSREAVARKTLVSACDIVVDGSFDKTLADPSLKWRGSSNQRIIDMQRSIQNGKTMEVKV